MKFILPMRGFLLSIFFVGIVFVKDAKSQADASPDELFKAGASAFQSGDYDRAAGNFEKLLAQVK
jgi:outer membrane protein assembly factor BamD (BamD/ComL family)